MIRALLLAALAAVAGAVLWLTLARAPQVEVSDAVATPLAGRPGVWTVSLTIRNAGPPDRLLGARAEGEATLMGLEGPGLALIVPGGDEVLLAPDGVHPMMTADADAEAGALVPLTLVFAEAGDVVARVRLSDMPGMAHGAMPGVAEAPAPSVTLSAPAGTGADGFAVALRTEGIAFREVSAGTAHVPGQGHAHLYLNGLKLGRAYADTMGIGALPAGAYRLRVGLNTHDHRPYLSDGAPVEDVLEFTVP